MEGSMLRGRRLLLLVALAAALGRAHAWAARCPAPVPVFEAGREVTRVCPDEAAASGLALVDLSDTWVPTLLRGQAYAATYIALADESPGKGHEWDRARADRYLELYGIAPNLRVAAARLLDEERHICHAAFDGTSFQALTKDLLVGDPTVAISPELLAVLEAHLVCEGLLPPSDK